jgi:TyrR family helix-turn-helix protein
MINSFLNRENIKFNQKKTIDPDLIPYLLAYNWPGNVRELENLIERLVITTKSNVITFGHIPRYILEDSKLSDIRSLPKNMTLKEALETTEKQILTSAVEKYKTTRQIAKALRVNQSTIVRKLNKYGISTNDE